MGLGSNGGSWILEKREREGVNWKEIWYPILFEGREDKWNREKKATYSLPPPRSVSVLNLSLLCKLSMNN